MSDRGADRAAPGTAREAGERLVTVRRVPDEATGTMLADFLREQGIEAVLRSVQIPWLGGVETMQHGYWGRLEVLEHDAERARAVIDDFYAARPEAEAGQLSEDEGGDPEGEGRA
jgi:hypothetical protein